VVKAFCS